MKSVLFHYSRLNLGGAERSLLRMLKGLADRGWAVTLVVTAGGGSLEAEVDPRIRLVALRPRAYGGRFLKARGLKARLRALPDLAAYAATRCLELPRLIPFLFRRYDAAAVGLQGASSWFVRRVVRARRRFHWIRNDLDALDPRWRVTARLREADPGIDGYVCVAQSVRDALVRRLPQTRGRSLVIYNLLDAAGMRARMADPRAPGLGRAPDIPAILTVARLSDHAKALFRLARVCQRLKAQGYLFHWYLVGDGADRRALEALITELQISDRLILLGPRSNPFPCYRDADLVAMVSHYEGLSGMVNEAKVCGKSVLAVKVSGIAEQLTDGLNGWVIENDEDAIVAGVAALLDDPERIARTTNRLYPAAILDDDLKLDQIERLFLG